MSLRKDPKRQQVFLDAVKATGNLREAARQASPHSEKGAMSTFKSYMRDDANFSARVGEALDEFRESLVREAVRRGRDGYDGRPIHYKGEIVGYERQYSDALLLAELRKHHPSDYATKHEHKVVVHPAGSWVISTEDLAHLSADEKQTLAMLMDRVREGRGERRAIEHRETIEDGEFEAVEDEEYASFDLGPGGIEQ